MNSDDWCVKCAKYLTFGIFETADDSALQKHNRRSLARNKINIYIYIYTMIMMMMMTFGVLSWLHNL